MTFRCLITGISGFIGSHFLEHVLVNTDWEVVGIASWQHKGMPERILDSEHYQRHRARVTLVTHDLNAPLSPMLERRLGPIHGIINFAADSHVDRSIDEPVPFIQNNVNLMLWVLEYARRVKPRVFVQVGTDESYGPAPDDYAHVEWDPIIPSNPYSASKAAQEAIAISYWRTYGVPVILTNTMNNIGERQDPEKFVPKIIRCLLQNRPVPIHAVDGKVGSRFYLHARNHADAILFLANHGPPAMYPHTLRPDRYNVVGEREISNLTLAQLIADLMGRPLTYELADAHSHRPGHDLRYALDGSKLAELGWTPPLVLERSLEKTIAWFLSHPEWLEI